MRFNECAMVQVTSNRYPLDLVERDLITGPVIELRRARAFVCGHGMGIFEHPAGLEVGGNAGRAEYVTTKFPFQAGLGGARGLPYRL